MVFFPRKNFTDFNAKGISRWDTKHVSIRSTSLSNVINSHRSSYNLLYKIVLEITKVVDGECLPLCALLIVSFSLSHFSSSSHFLILNLYQFSTNISTTVVCINFLSFSFHEKLPRKWEALNRQMFALSSTLCFGIEFVTPQGRPQLFTWW